MLLISADLPGMDVIARTEVVIHNNRAKSFEWKGYGFKLLIPSDVLPHGVESCIITIRVGLFGHFQLPQQYDLISATYEIRTTTELARPITMEIEHCSHCNSPHDSRNLTFAVAKTSQKEPPYKFELRQGGFSPSLSQYGSISIQQFSVFTILRYIGQCFLPSPPLHYCAHLYYIRKKMTDWRIHFVITRDLEVEFKVCMRQSHIMVHTVAKILLKYYYICRW